MTVEVHRQLSSSASSCSSNIRLWLTSPFALFFICANSRYSRNTISLPSIRVLQHELVSLPSIRVLQDKLIVFNVLRTARTRCLQCTVSRTAMNNSSPIKVFNQPIAFSNNSLSLIKVLSTAETLQGMLFTHAV